MKPYMKATPSQPVKRESASHSGSAFDKPETQAPGSEAWPQARILLVNADPLALLQLSSRLSDGGYEVVAVPTFQGARERFRSIDPDLMIADIRLEAFNGLHLAYWARFEHPNVPVIITHTWYDPVLESEAQRFGATFVAVPLDNPDFLKHVLAAVGEHHGTRHMARPL